MPKSQSPISQKKASIVCGAIVVVVALVGVSVYLGVRYSGSGTQQGGINSSEPGKVNVFEPVQATPPQADWSRLTTNVDHSPLSSWPSWDGQIVDSDLPGKLLAKAACEKGIVRGMYDAFPEPFKDPFKPTKAEIDTYNTQIIVQIRRIFAIQEPIAMDACLSARALWADEFKFERGDCTGKRSHCGASIGSSKPPDSVWQKYVPADEALKNPLCKHNTRNGTSEGISGSSLSVIWPARLQNVFCGFIKEGFRGHGGPLKGRSLFGVSFYNKKGSKGIAIRVKWSG
ncbi:MAG: hypothetical protein SGCHY_003515 [Lobulomycetales sp.]